MEVVMFVEYRQFLQVRLFQHPNQLQSQPPNCARSIIIITDKYNQNVLTQFIHLQGEISAYRRTTGWDKKCTFFNIPYLLENGRFG